ncbi:phage repressor protein CI [Nissabacter sp. SGAir0207]|uniref:phage repressor protein CI n=1 Tax=Nissabacter sp. SGAir0207 TaxID=2126321 RepID=UPI0010CCCF90|nr:phage repressor protein CI [Nissabacter sp. SGAir0207]QCR38027.1 phage repressor protein CI [Nissabacter sp. SGAir0207]
MKFDTSNLDNVKILDRICSVYGFHQKIQLANHFEIAASSLSNRYTRGNISYDFAALCALETGASLLWILTGKGERFEGEGVVNDDGSEFAELQKFTLSEGKLVKDSLFCIDRSVIGKANAQIICVSSEHNLHLVEETTVISDGMKLVDIGGTICIRELTVLPGQKVHVTGGKVSFDCAFDDIKTLGRVIGIYSELS